MNRYLFYLILNHILINGVGYVPRILYEDRFSGTTLSLLLSVLTGFLLLVFFLHLFKSFPQQGLPEMMLHFPAWIRIPYLIYLMLYTTLAGSTSLLVLTDVSTRYLNTESSDLVMISLFLLFFFLFIHLPSEKMLFGVEILTLLTLPFVLFTIYIGITHQEMLWDGILVAAKHFDPPTWSAFNAGNYLFCGFLYLITFNRVLTLRSRISLWSLSMPALFLFSIFVIYFLPIGLLGSNAISHYPYPWIAAADTFRIPLGPTERAIFLFFILYIIIAGIDILIHFHISLDLFRSFLGRRNLEKKSPVRHLPTLMLILLFLAIYTLYQRLHEFDFFRLEKEMLNLLFPTEVSLLLILLIIRIKDRKR